MMFTLKDALQLVCTVLYEFKTDTIIFLESFRLWTAKRGEYEMWNLAGGSKHAISEKSEI